MKEILMNNIKTSMGISNKWSSIPGLTKENEQVLNDIGYGKIKDLSLAGYLNGLDNGYVYGVTCVSSNGCEYTNEYIVAVYKK